MPLYEYACDACGRHFERIQKYSDPPIATCPTCGAPVRKLLSSPAIQFKGSGFYATDYPKQSMKGKSEGGESKAGESKAGESKSGESKSGESKGGESHATAGKDSSTASSSSTSAKESAPAAPSPGSSTSNKSH